MAARCRLCALLLGLACGAEPPGSAERSNLLVNGSFEQGRDPWYDFEQPEKPYWGSYEISDARAFDGRRGLSLQLDSADFPGAIGISGAAQGVAATALPRTLSGRLWKR